MCACHDKITREATIFGEKLLTGCLLVTSIRERGICMMPAAEGQGVNPRKAIPQ